MEGQAQVHYDVKETKEALVGLNEVSLLMVRRFSDGMQFEDFKAFWDAFKHDPEFEAKMKAAFDGWAKIPAEVKDMDLKEGIELVGVQVEYVPKLLAAFKEGSKPAALPAGDDHAAAETQVEATLAGGEKPAGDVA